jgi:hypothetical protein
MQKIENVTIAFEDYSLVVRPGSFIHTELSEKMFSERKVPSYRRLYEQLKTLRGEIKQIRKRYAQSHSIHDQELLVCLDSLYRQAEQDLINAGNSNISIRILESIIANNFPLTPTSRELGLIAASK